ncbi:MAG: globin [Phototrophicales bacterium]|nr:MAG: globin [Phototrophicales bacterium]
MTEATIFDMIGGEYTFRRLVDAFYARVEQDEVLRPMFPADLEPGKHYQFLFLMQYFGGPALYAVERGHPRLRMRHNPFPIDTEARDRWLGHMLCAIDEVGIPEPARTEMRTYFERGSAFMINVDVGRNQVEQS